MLLPRARLVSARPVSACASERKVSAARWLAETSAIICPLFAAVPNTCGSNGIVAIGSNSSALAKSADLISGRFGTPTMLRQYCGRLSFGREARNRSIKFLVLRRFARSGAATIRMSSAPISVRRAQPVQMCGTSRMMQGAVERHHRVRDALRRVLVEVEAGGAERQVEVGDDRIEMHLARDRECDVVRDRRGAD